MKLIIFTNSIFEEQKALYDVENQEVIATGDCYHDKINEHIDGIVTGIRHCGFEVELERGDLLPEDGLFDLCDFVE